MEIFRWFMIAVALSLGVVNFLVTMKDAETWIHLHTKVATLEEKVRRIEKLIKE